jgi:hypothetical protein
LRFKGATLLCLLLLLLLLLPLLLTNRDCPGVFMRFVEDPQANSVKLTLKDLNPQQQQQQQQQQQAGSSTTAAAAAQAVEIQLSQHELQQLLKQLVLALSSCKSGSSSSSSMSPTAAALGEPGNRQITLQPISSSSSSSSSSTLVGGTAAAAAAAAASGGRLQLLIDGVLAAELSPAHVTSLVTVMEDLVGQLPALYSTAPPAVQVCLTGVF